MTYAYYKKDKLEKNRTSTVVRTQIRTAAIVFT